jgi:hypothetical protein
MIFQDLTKVLDIALMQFGVDNSIEVFLENIDSPTSTATPYLSSFVLLAPVQQADLSVSEYRQGIYQVDVNYASNLGSEPINIMADLLNAAFKTGQHLTRNDVCVEIEGVDLGPLMVAGGWAKRPLSINWNLFTARL